MTHLSSSSSRAPTDPSRLGRGSGEVATVDDRRGRRVVYVIDDSEDARDLVGEALRDAGYRVLEARDGREALELLLELPTPAAIVLDLLMPVMDGYEVLDLLASYMRLARVPTLVVTASGEPIDLQIPYARCVRKPIDGEHVVEALEQLIATAQAGGR
jgi:CheY-like chemotaxis protein